MWKPVALAALLIAALATSSVAVLASRDGGGTAGQPTFPVDLNLQSDACGHDPFIWNEDPPPHNLTLSVNVDGQNVSIESSSSKFVGVSGTLKGKGDQVFATGAGTVAGFEDVTVQFQGTLTETSLTGQYTMGANNELPECDHDDNQKTPDEAHPAVYEVKPKATPTPPPTATPQKLYEIIVVKEDANGQGLEDWEINIYAGPDCDGNPFQSGFTDEHGVLVFDNLEPGTYSVEEKPQEGWNPLGPECENVEVPGGSGVAGLPDCPVDPNLPHPDPGCDEFNSLASVGVNFTNPPLESIDCDLSGPTQIRRNPLIEVGGLDTVPTEITAMELEGSCTPGNVSVTVTESPSEASTGLITEQQNEIDDTLEFKADSYFDVLFEVETPLGTLHNQDPLRLACKIQDIPPSGCFYEPDVGVVTLYNEDKKVVGELVHARHIPIGPKNELVIFTNERKPTPTSPPGATPTPTPTATPPVATATPPEGFSITVLKLHAATKAPLPGWQMNLYQGAGCLGAPIASGPTGSNGIIDFVGLQAGTYSVQEKGQPGWNPVTPECQDVEAGAAGASGATIPCPIAPDQPFPDAGCDAFDSGAQVNIDLNLDDIPDMTATLNGPTVVTRGALSGTTIDTEIVQLDLTGGGVTVRQSPTQQSLGEIENVQTNPDGTFDEGDSFFDVFFEVDVGAQTLHNQDPFRIECHITSLPPTLCLYQPPLPDPISLVDAGGVERARLVHGVHLPLPEGEVLVVFENAPKKANGDVNCDDQTNSIDALLILQLVAGLLAELPCPENADVNDDGVTNALDSLLILQLDAGLIEDFPPKLAGSGPALDPNVTSIW